MALSLYHKKPPEGGLLLITSDGGTCKPYALFCLDGTSIVSQAEQDRRIRAAKTISDQVSSNISFETPPTDAYSFFIFFV